MMRYTTSLRHDVKTLNKESCDKMKHMFMLGDKKITIYPSAVPDMPIIYLNTFTEEDGSSYKALTDTQYPDFTLVTISGLAWDCDMAPWDIAPIARNDMPRTGGADAYLQLFLNELVPKAEAYIQGNAAWRGLAGYSLAGLFAVYSMYQTTMFSRIASMSGSLWYPNFKEYVFSREPLEKPSRLYFSLGDKESRTKNPYLKTVQENTEAIREFYQNQGIDTALEMNPGGHYKDTAARTKAGIAWLLSK